MIKEETTSYYSDIDWLHLYADGTASAYHSSCGCCEQEEKIGTTKELLDYIDEEIKNLTEFRNSLIRQPVSNGEKCLTCETEVINGGTWGYCAECWDEHGIKVGFGQEEGAPNL